MLVSLRLFLFTVVFFSSSVFAESAKFKVGMILPLSGPAADYGTSIQNCVDMARSDTPELFDNIEFVYEDAQLDSKQAASAFKKLTAGDDVDVVYAFSLPFCQVLSPMAEAAKKPFVAQCIDKDATYGKEYALRFMNDTDQYLEAQVERLASLGKFKLGVILGEHPYTEAMYASLKRNLRPDQTLELVDSFQPAELDFRTTVSKLKRKKFDAVGVFLFLRQTAQFYRQAKEQHFDVATFGTNLFESVSEIKLAKGAMTGAEFANGVVKKSFAERYAKLHGNVSQLGFGALGYEFAVTTGRLFNDLENRLTSEEIMERFKTSDTFPGVAAGPYEYRNSKETGQYFHFPIVMKQINGSRFDIVK